MRLSVDRGGARRRDIRNLQAAVRAHKWWRAQSLKNLADTGEIEIHAEGHSPAQDGGGGRPAPTGGQHTPTTGERRSGDR
jgi:hypothetical protein